VTECTEVQTENGIKTPAKDAGIKAGDYILSVGGKEVTTNEDISALVEASRGENMTFKIMRGETKIYLKVKAEKAAENGQYKLGIWVKDSTAGIGMLTFYSPTSNALCGLGHGICDDKTGELLKLKNGEIVEAQIISVEKGEVGAAGQLKGKFGYKSYGKISENCHKGVYSKTTLGDMGEFVEIALKQDIKNGQAKILCTVDGDTPKYYDCTVEVRSAAYHSETQNLNVTITDKELLSLTGGIVQGMSGSPILQNGKLIGAVTHVLVDDPTKGYGIFAENMLETAQNVAQEQQLKEVS
jgi:stage IV sporulation protein B